MLTASSHLALNFQPHVWGTVGQWASAIGTLSAFSATFYVIKRDAKVRRRSQAQKVALYIETVDRQPDEVDGKYDTWYDLTVKNLSEEPIYDVAFWMINDRGQLLDGLGSETVLLPDQTYVQRSGYSNVAFGSVDVLFRDNGGRHWRRNVEGHLTERSRLELWRFAHFYNDPPLKAMWRKRQIKKRNKKMIEESVRRRAERRKQREQDDSRK